MTDKIKITFFGDSICVGQGVSIHNGWRAKISAKLTTKYNNLVISSAAENGRTSRQALEKMPFEIQADSPDLLLIQYGMNDCNYWKTDNGVPRVSKKSFRANLFEMIERAQHNGVKKVYINTNHPTTRNNIFPKTNITYQESNSQYNSIIKEVCAQSAAELIDIEKHIIELCNGANLRIDDFLLEDGLHLSELGHDIYYKLIYPKIDQFLDRK